MIYVVVTMKIKPESREAFLDLFHRNRPAVLAEEGCHIYQLCTAHDGSEPNTFTLIEEWESEAHLQAHLAAPHMQAFSQAATPLRESAAMQKLAPA